MNDTRTPAYRNSTVWKVSFAASAVVSLLHASSSVIGNLSRGAYVAAWEPLTWEVTSGLASGALVPFVAEFALRCRITRAGLWLRVPAHLLAAAVYSLAHVAAMVGLRHGVYALAGSRYEFGDVRAGLLFEGFRDAVIYALIVAITYGVDYYHRYRQRELNASRLETSLATARLEALEQHVQPHFLFNTLNMISSIMHENVDKADHMLTHLSDLLRLSVGHRGAQQVPLSEELEILHAYLEIMEVRFEDRLEVVVDASMDCEDALVPPFLLQPLVENAIKHGIARRGGGGHVHVAIERRGSSLEIQVTDDGPGTSASLEELLEKGVGLSATVERLSHLYDQEHTFRVGNGDLGGLEVSVTLPYRASPRLVRVDDHV